MNNITSMYKSEITSKSTINIESCTDLNVESNIANREREAFLLTAKHNASIMFSKYL